mgnify:FL=1
MSDIFRIQYLELRSDEQIEKDRLERVRLNKEFFDSGQDFKDPNHKVHYARLQGVTGKDGDVMYYKNGQTHVDYYIRAAKKLGLTVAQAEAASKRGAEAGSGKTRDNMVREFRDKNFGTNEQEQYAANRALAKKVTAASYARMSDTELAYYQQMPEAINFARKQVKTVDPTFTALDTPDRATITISQITENSASVNWSAMGAYISDIIGYHYVLKNNSTGQTIKEYDLFTTSGLNYGGGQYEQNLVKGNSYTVFLIAKNRYGNSPESKKSFRTLGIDVIEEEKRLSEEARVQREFDREIAELKKIEIQQKTQTVVKPIDLGFNLDGTTYPITQPEIIPEGFHKMPDGSIMADSDMDKIQLPTIEIPTIIPPVAFAEEIEENYSVNVYNIRDNGDVFATTYLNISGAKLEELSKSYFVLSLDADRLPTNKEVQDFYNFIPDTLILENGKTPDSKIDSTMVSQSVGAFILKDGRVNGEILYIANQSFNPFYYGKNLTSLVQIKSKSGVVIAIKTNNLNFTENQRDERITIQESAGNFKELVVDFFVWDSPLSMQIFAQQKQIQIVDESDVAPSEPFDPQPPKKCQSGYHKDFSGKCVPDDPQPEIPRDKLIDTLKGFLFGTVALSLLASKD